MTVQGDRLAPAKGVGLSFGSAKGDNGEVIRLPRWPATASGVLGFLLLAVIHSSQVSAQANDVDWKYYGGAPIFGDLSLCFYDAKGIVKRSDGHLRVWTKCLSQKEMDNFDPKTELGEKIAKAAAQKIATYDLPPIAILENYTVPQIIQATNYETLADLSYIRSRARIFYEVNCPERMIQTLSIDFLNHAGDDKPSEWQYVPPEGNAATMLKLICPQ